MQTNTGEKATDMHLFTPSNSDAEMKRTVMETPLGRMAIEAEKNAITAVFYTDEAVMASEDQLLQEAQKQLQQYFAGMRKEFDLPLKPEGTPFQLAAWEALQKIPYGETRTYGQQAAMMGKAAAARAVGGANHKNPIAIIIPCHRVVAADGMGGYAAGADKKQYLIALEGQNKAQNEDEK